MEMLAEIGVYSDVTNLVAAPTHIQWMVKAGYGLALIDDETGARSCSHNPAG